MSVKTSVLPVQNAVTDTFRVRGFSVLNQSDVTIPWSVFKTDLNLGDDSIITVSTTFTVVQFNTIYFVDATAGAFTVTLPTAAGNIGKRLQFKKIDATTNIITIAPILSQTIDLDANLTLEGTGQPFVEIHSDGANWKITNA